MRESFDHLATASDDVDSVLDDLIDVLTVRLQGGEPVDLEEVSRRHPEYADRLRRLLPALVMMADFGQSSPSAVRMGQGAGPEPGLGPAVLGDFRILREVGRGGMGVVYEAEQISLDRRVALKVVPMAAVLDGKHLQRFQLEAHAAACLHHTNIVPVHAVGCERGVPFYAMQYIEGRSLAQLIAELRRLEGLAPADKSTAAPANAESGAPAPAPSNQVASPLPGRFAQAVEPGVPAEPGPDMPFSPSLMSRPAAADPLKATRRVTVTTGPGSGSASDASTRSRAYIRTAAQLGVQVAEALDHAHTRGILHRDIKPANLLLDDEGQLWVTDFGLAQVQGNPCLTVTGDVLGTLRYMSPEQALAKRVLIDGRTDVYSLGATLYELLTLRPAIDGQDRQEILRKIAEAEPVPLRRLNPAVPRDLETILLKAMAKDPGGRYATAKDLADELRRFLELKPITAHRQSPLDRAAKWARRHQAVVWTAGISLAVLLLTVTAALGVSNVLITREKDRKDRALAEKAHALKQRELALATARANERAAQANLYLARKAVDDLYEQTADKFRDLPQMQSLEQEFLQKALNFYLEFARQKSPDPEIRLGTGQAYRRVGLIHYKLNQHQRAEEALTEAIARLEALVAENSSDPRYTRELAGAYHDLGLVLTETQGIPKAEQAHRRNIELLQRLLAQSHDAPADRMMLATAYNSLGTQLHGRPREAERAHRAAIALCEKLVADFPGQFQCWGELVRGHYTLGLLQAQTGRFQEAENPFRDALAVFQQQAGPLNASYYRRLFPVAHLELAKVLYALGRTQDARDAYRAAIVLLEQYVVSYPRISEYWVRLYECYANLVRLLEQTGDAEEAARACDQALDLYERLAGRLPEEIADEGMLRIATELDAVLKNRISPQERGYRCALEVSETLAGRRPTLLGYQFHAAYWQTALGGLLLAMGQTPEAASSQRQAVARYHAALGLDPKHVLSLNNLAWLLATSPDPQFRDPDRAVTLAKQATALRPQAERAWNTLGVAHYRAGDWPAAIVAFERARAVHSDGPDALELAIVNALFQGMSRWQTGERDKPRGWYDQVVQEMKKSQPHDQQLLRFRAEAEELIQIKDRAQSETRNGPC